MSHNALVPLECIAFNYDMYLNTLVRLSDYISLQYPLEPNYARLTGPHFAEVVDAADSSYRAREEFRELNPLDYTRIEAHLNCFNTSVMDATTHMRNLIEEIRREDERTVFYPSEPRYTTTNYLDIDSFFR